jgi:hypothetical protein
MPTNTGSKHSTRITTTVRPPFEVAETNAWTVALFIKAALDAAAHVVQDGLVNLTQLLPPLRAALDVAVLSAAAATGKLMEE